MINYNDELLKTYFLAAEIPVNRFFARRRRLKIYSTGQATMAEYITDTFTITSMARTSEMIMRTSAAPGSPRINYICIGNFIS
ncbi:MAG: hypothetical protein LBR10_15900 [Prevotellaceae bacterium]|nr:hypothetical protein [Prevotellaceae bacterium]